MDTFFNALLDRFQKLHAEYEKSLELLPPEALDWVPGPEMNSPSVIVIHVAENTRYFVGEVVLGEASGFDREAGFQTKGLSQQALISRFRDLEIYLEASFAKLSLPDLDRLITHPRTGKAVPAAYFLFLALSHTATHLGHLQITVQLWQQKDH